MDGDPLTCTRSKKKPVHPDGPNITERKSRWRKYQRTLSPHSLRHDYRFAWTRDESPGTSGRGLFNQAVSVAPR
ncbi:hypothetical protein LMG28614_03616 [Paraburkholderia ultramafica]|uniref:Uncharacterized protein n=1 Tax=Paraburkholderia ultramafica TaxID=1544867 RepID=A0A6S7D0Q8_9BURK|nr:hypothetical protein LMG28614_03616 [Paraburkholderia ultramafica]